MSRIVLRVGALACLSLLCASLLTSPAAAQFDPQHNNLKCYKIGGPVMAQSLQLDDQFGRERVFKLVPQFLCNPAQKSCCDAAGCSPTKCNPEPSPNQPAAVDHFKCYKIQQKECTPTAAGGFDCTKLTGRFPPIPPKIQVLLRDQFHDESLTVGHPKLLCVPVVKFLKVPPPPCGLDAAGQCSGTCPNTTDKCLFLPGVGCTCRASDEMCMDRGGTCSGLCAGPNQQCTLGPAGCACLP